MLHLVWIIVFDSWGTRCWTLTWFRVSFVCSVGGPGTIGCACQHRKSTSLHPCMLWSRNKPEGFSQATAFEKVCNEPIRGVRGKQWAIIFPDICLSWAHSSGAELLTLKPTLEMQPIFTNMQAHRGQSLGLFVGNGVICSTLKICFSEIFFHPPHQFDSEGTMWTRKSQAF